MDRNRHTALWLRMLAKNEIRLARTSFKILKTLSVEAASEFEKNGQASAEDVLLEGRDAFYRALNISYTGTTKELISYTFEELGYGKKATFQEIVQGYIQTQALEKSILITGTTQSLMRAAILKGQQQGLGVSQIASDIRKAVSSTAPSRARTIARTETHNAASFGMQTAAEETGLSLDKQWVCVDDDRTRDDHLEADEQTVDLDEMFDVGGELIDRPGEGSPENSINCRCTLIYIPKEF